ncbi:MULTISPECIES: hypothetical protein [Mycolicibacter]|uniref:Uncharacterized protein n=2 Tax=Mycolicibacter TaxID=1073531 RepID=A0ABU5XM20_9MYCO|nr:MULTISPECIES: hypothetical protein [unclassified Mycolicibacter]MEB3023013.1 hypothetical protein [Mycolicibacter sp. MYC098]MEB3033523.1 hypothetical protein [Mycolicibacter sp. MYC340]
MDDLDLALARVAQAQAAHREALEALHAVIRQLIAAGPRGTQAKVARRTGYTREHLRQIVQHTALSPKD